MAFPDTDCFGLNQSGLLEVKYRGRFFTICRVAQWAYMAVVVLEDTTDDEYRDSLLSIAAWHIDCEFARKIIEDNNYFAATVLHKQNGRNPDLVATYSTKDGGPLVQIYKEVQSGIRKPIEDRAMDRLFKEMQTQQLKKVLDRYGEHPRFSDKKVWPGILMLLIYPLGLPFFYFCRPLWGWIMLSCLAASVLFMPMLFVACPVGCVLIVMLLVHLFGDRIKDKDGRLVCTQAKQKRILNSIAQYKQNVAELAAEDAQESRAFLRNRPL